MREKQCVIFIGPPGAGKDTQSELLADDFGFNHFRTSRIIEEKIKNDVVNEVKQVDPDRKSVIISALKGGGPSNVSEVAKLFNGTIGEKTVQRELNGLVEVGVIKKEGEKRWRRYFL
jgi:broad-specificity NMP kinase